jgi:ATP-dependent helicase HepA
LAREDLAFLSIDHPMVRGVVDLILGGMEGTVGFVEWPDAPTTGNGSARGFAMDAIFVLEATAPGYLHIDRFLAPCPIRVMVEQSGEDLTHFLPRMDASELEQAPTGLLEDHHDQFDLLVPKMMEAAMQAAAFRQASLKTEAHKEAEKRLGAERDRLKALMTINPSVTQSEVDDAEKLLRDVLGHIAAAELRLDAVRLVILGRMRQ